jgi:hypothetical protein
MREGDHIKARFYGDSVALLRWAEIQQSIKDMIEADGARCFSVEFVSQEKNKGISGSAVVQDTRDDAEIFKDYCSARGLEPEYAEAGASWL